MAEGHSEHLDSAEIVSGVSALSVTAEALQGVLDEVPSEYVCLLCKNILRNPALLPCGHSFCMCCVEWLLRNHSDPECQVCGGKIVTEDAIFNIGSIKLDEGKRKEAERLRSKYLEEGCTSAGTLIQDKTAEHHDYWQNKKENCLFEGIGCMFQGQRSDIQDHIATSLVQHIDLLLAEVLRYKKSSNLGPIFPWKSDTANDRESRDARSVCDDEASAQSLQDLHKTLQVLETEISRCEKKASACEEKISVTVRKVKYCSSLLVSLQQQMDICRKADADSEKEERVFQRQLIGTCLPRRAEVSHNGIFIWKIPNFHMRRQEAICGTTEYLESTAFYTHLYGYKMALQVYLNGDLNAKGTHISVHLKLLKGEFDVLLKWPFKEQIMERLGGTP
ncbi:TNF receptor-associated factor 2-like isoform X2 [Rhinatrema bivittatum]|uniref:TNF receptor-associated factor 2-like isoform X2 n=1 Tax=Rhinatrema bivittatum TaxID=194408 RepID=UPI001127CE64|nr:TNF receptor-associated factor 2-like isoform X2 [Rhinatrema bivittatum]